MVCFMAALRGVEERVDVLASEIGTEPAALRAAALLLPLTWLPAFKREAAARMSHAWPAGYCPCGGS